MTTTDTVPGGARRTAIYARISSDPNKKGEGVDRQLRRCRDFAAANGLTIVEEYVDNDVSAWTESAIRPGFLRLMADLTEGRFSDLLLDFDDRFSRQNVHMENLIRLSKQTDGGVVIHFTEEPAIDLRTAAGQKNARDRITNASYESARKSERLRRTFVDYAEKGLPHPGRRCYGYTKSGTDVEPDEVDVVQEVAARVLAGESQLSVCTDLNVRGITTSQGAPWRSRTLRNMLLNPRYTGVRVHKGQTYSSDAIPKILDDQIHLDLTRVLTDPDRLTNRTGSSARTFLLPGFIYCAKSDLKMVSWRRYNSKGSKGVRMYACKNTKGDQIHTCGMTIGAEPVEEIVKEAVFDLLTTQSDDVEPDSAYAEAQERVELLQSRLVSLDEDWDAGEIRDRGSYETRRTKIIANLESAEQAQAEAYLGASLADVPLDLESLTKAWETRSLDWKRSVLDAVLEKVVIHPAKASGRASKPADRVEVIARQRHYGERGIKTRRAS